jgi:hypothetical protein
MRMAIFFTHRFCTIPLLALTAVLSGCTSRLEKPRLPDVFVDPAPGRGTNGTYSLSAFNDDFTAYKLALHATPVEPAALTARNNMIDGVMAEIDYVYGNYEIALFMNEGSFKVATDVLQLGLGVASTITNGARSKTVLSAVLTGVTGTSLSIDKNFFRQQTVQALISSMEAGRDRTKTLIKLRETEPVSSYSFQAARSDLSAYFFAGTLPGALQQLSQTAAANAEVQRQTLTGVTLKDVSDATKLNFSVAQAFATKNLDKVVVFLNAMNDVKVDASDPAKVEAAYRNLAKRALDDKDLMKKFMQEAANAGLIK